MALLASENFAHKFSLTLPDFVELDCNQKLCAKRFVHLHRIYRKWNCF
jgi:hypothetical protein